MTAKVITFASSKGGSGKTTIAASMAQFLTEIGKRVLLVDCDDGTNGMTLMFLKEVHDHQLSSSMELCGVFDKVDEKGGFNHSIVELPGGFSLLPATFRFKNKMKPGLGTKFKSIFARILEEVSKDFDFVLIDSQAGIGTVSRVTVSTDFCDQVILVSEYDPLSNAGVERMKAILPNDLDTTRTWILLNKLLPEFVEKFSEFLTIARYLPPIEWNADVVRAYSRRGLAVDFTEFNRYTLSIMAILESLLLEEDLEALFSWQAEREAALVGPIEKKISDAKEQIAMRQERISALGPPSIFTILVRDLLRPSSSRLVFTLFITMFAVSMTFVGFFSFLSPGGFEQFILDINQISDPVDPTRLISLFAGIFGAATLFIILLRPNLERIYDAEVYRRGRYSRIGDPRYEISREVEKLEAEVKQLSSLKNLKFRELVEKNEASHASTRNRRSNSL